MEQLWHSSPLKTEGLSRKQSDWHCYKKIQKEAQQACQRAHDDYISNMVSEPGSNNKKLFAYIKDMKCDSSGVAPLKKDGINYSETTDQVEILNEEFVTAFTKEDCTSIPTMGNSAENSVPPLNIQVNGVKKLLLGQKPHKASGQDQISPWFLKETAFSITPALTLIYQASYEGQIPDDWKRAFVTPLFKKGNRSKASNYPPVSLTLCCYKVMEHIVHSHEVPGEQEDSERLPAWLQEEEILWDSAHHHCTWRRKFSIGLDRRHQVDAILLDFSKGFDKVPHQPLAVKLYHYGVRDKIYPGSKVFSRIEIIKWSLIGRHHLMLLLHSEFQRAQCLDLCHS